MALFIRYQPLALGGGGGGATLTMGTFDGQAGSAAGASIVASQLFMQSATALVPGSVNIGTQTFAGQKTFSTGLTGTLTGHATLDVATSSLGNLTDAGTDGIVVTGGTGAVVGTVSLAQHVADTTHNGYLSSTDWNTFNGKQAAGNYITALTGDGTASGPGSSTLTFATVNSNVGSFTPAAITVNAKGLVTAASNVATTNLTDAGTDGIVITNGTGAVLGASPVTIAQHVADSTHNGYLSSTDWSTFNSKQATVSIGAFNGTSTANGLDITASVLTLHAADGTNPGAVSTTTQTFAGQKTFSTGLTGTLTGAASLNVLTSALGNLTDAGTDGIVVTGGTGAVVGSVSLAQHVSDSTHNGYLSSTDWSTFNSKQATVSIGTFSASSTANGLDISSGVLTLHAADGTNPGALTTAAQSIAGVKTFASAPIITPLTASRAMVTGASSELAISATTSTQIGYLSTTTSDVQVQLDAKVAKSTLTTKGDTFVATGSATVVRQAIGSDGQVLTADSAQTNGLKWATAASAPTSSPELSNLGLSATVATNALTVALKQSDGSTNPSTGTSAVTIGFRSSTATTGGYAQRSVTGALSVVISSGSTLGTANSGVQYLYVYGIDNAGTVELAVAGMATFDEGKLWNTTAEGGAGAADSPGVLYSTTARTGVAIRLIGRIRISEATAGTWATSPTEVSVSPFPRITAPTLQKFTSGSGTYTTPTSPSIPLYLKIRMVAGGGGGGGASTGAGNGGSGGVTTFGTSLLSAAAGSGGSTTGTGGSASSGSSLGGVSGLIVEGGGGGNATGTVINTSGGNGGSSFFGGAGVGGLPGVLDATGATANSGSGGGGAQVSAASGAGAGGAGGYIEAIITSPLTTYAYAVGAAGAAGASSAGRTGGAGGAGVIEVWEYYQ